MADDDIRISRWGLLASAGTTQRLIFTVSEPITTLAVYVGGTTADVDDLTGATAYNATVVGLEATVDVDIPTRADITGQSTPIRLVVDGAVVTVGQLTPSATGTSSPDNTITVAPAAAAYTLTVGGIVVVEGGGAGADDQTAAEVPFTPAGTVAATDVQAAIVEVSGDVEAEAVTRAAADTALSDSITTEQTVRANADTALDGRLDTVEADYVQAGDLAGYQPIDSDLTAIAALTTSAFGRGLLALADAAAGRTTLGVYSTAQTDAAIAALVDAAPGTLDTLNELAAALGDDPNFATTITDALAGKQPLDADLTAIAALTTTAYGRSLLEAANAAALRTLAGVYSTAEVDTAISNAASSAVPKALVDAKGDLLAASANDTVARLPVGTNGQVLTADTAETLGVKWATPAAGGAGVAPRWTTGRYYAAYGQHDAIAQGVGAMTFVPLWVPSGATVDRIGCHVTTAAASAVGRVGIYADTGNGLPGALILDAGTVDASTTGAKEVTISQSLGTNTLVWVALVSQTASAGFRALNQTPLIPMSYAGLTGALASNPGSGFFQTGVTGALPANASIGGDTTRPYQIAVRAA